MWRVFKANRPTDVVSDYKGGDLSLIIKIINSGGKLVRSGKWVESRLTWKPPTLY